MCQGPQAVNGEWQMLQQANPLEADHIVPAPGVLMLFFPKKLKAGISFCHLHVSSGSTVCEFGGFTVKQILDLKKKKDHGGPLLYSII